MHTTTPSPAVRSRGRLGVLAAVATFLTAAMIALLPTPQASASEWQSLGGRQGVVSHGWMLGAYQDDDRWNFVVGPLELGASPESSTRQDVVVTYRILREADPDSGYIVHDTQTRRLVIDPTGLLLVPGQVSQQTVFAGYQVYRQYTVEVTIAWYVAGTDVLLATGVLRPSAEGDTACLDDSVMCHAGWDRITT